MPDAPFPYFGGKRKVADRVWAGLGDVRNYVEPFAGSAAVLLRRPHAPRIETINDLDGLIAIVWRALAKDPDGVAREADWPVNEVDLHARHRWLVENRAGLTRRAMDDPEFYDVRAAGWWLWGASMWIGGGWCRVVQRQMPRAYAEGGQGVHGVRVSQKRPHLAGEGGGVGVHSTNRRDALQDWFRAIKRRLRGVRVLCGDFERALGDSVVLGSQASNFKAGVFLDPTYPHDERQKDIYAVDDPDVPDRAFAWCEKHGDDPRRRIVLAGFEGERGTRLVETHGWSEIAWKTDGGYSNQSNGGHPGSSQRDP